MKTEKGSWFGDLVAGINRSADQARTAFDVAIANADERAITQNAENLALVSRLKRMLGVNGKSSQADGLSDPASDTPRQKRQYVRRNSSGASESPHATRKVRARNSNGKIRVKRGTSGFTTSPAYRPWILCAFYNLGDWSSFRTVQDKMFEMMDGQSLIQPADREKTNGTTRPRWLSQTSALRYTLLKQGVIMSKSVDGHVRDWLTEKGVEELKASVAARFMANREVDPVTPKVKKTRGRPRATESQDHAVA